MMKTQRSREIQKKWMFIRTAKPIFRRLGPPNKLGPGTNEKDMGLLYSHQPPLYPKVGLRPKRERLQGNFSLVGHEI